jgi:hypothetical protein
MLNKTTQFISQAAAKGHAEDKVRENLERLKLLRNMRLINRTRLAMLDCLSNLFKSELSSRIYGCGICTIT